MLQIWNHRNYIEIITDKKSLENMEEEEKIRLTISNELLSLMVLKAVKGEHLLYDSEKNRNNNIQTG